MSGAGDAIRLEAMTAGTILSQLDLQEHDPRSLAIAGLANYDYPPPGNDDALGEDPQPAQAPKKKKDKINKRICKADGCWKKDQAGGFCHSHGGGTICRIEGCSTKSQPGRHLCFRHDMGEANLCRFEGCKRKNAGRGFCIAHGGGKRCKFENCGKSAQRRGFCKQHGGRPLKCKVIDCQRAEVKGGFCRVHRIADYAAGQNALVAPVAIAPVAIAPVAIAHEPDREYQGVVQDVPS